MCKYLVSIMLALAFFIGFSLSHAHAMTINEAIKEMARMMQKSLPQRLGENISLVQVSYLENTISLSYIVHKKAYEILPVKNKLEIAGHKEKASALCMNKDPRWILDHGGIYNFIFTSEDGVFLYSYDVSKADC